LRERVEVAQARREHRILQAAARLGVNYGT
jgi:hypothetical protein